MAFGLVIVATGFATAWEGEWGCLLADMELA
jgi:hypothetical protein